MRVLILDDDEHVLRLARLALERAGVTVDTATDAPAAETLAVTRRPDVILLDVQMPGEDGRSVLARLRSGPAAHIPVIFFSAESRPGDVANLVRLGAAGVIRKPFAPATLAAEVRAIVGGRIEEQGEPLRVPHELRAAFLLSAVDTLDEIERCLDDLQGDPMARQQLRTAATHFHRLAGAAGSFALPLIGDTARAGEEEFDRMAKSADAPPAETLGRWRSSIGELRRQLAVASGEPRTADQAAIRVLWADSSHAYGAARQIAGEDSRFRIDSAASAADALSALDLAIPDIALVSADLGGDAGLAVVERLRELPHGVRSTVLLFANRPLTTEEIDHAQRLSVSQLLDPEDDEDTLAALRDAAEQKEGRSARVLCVGDKHAAAFATVLESAGFKVAVADGSRLDAELERFEPGVVLCDAGEEPAAALQVIRRVSLLTEPGLCPVVLVSEPHSPALTLDAVRAGAADILTVPLPRALLLSVVANRAMMAGKHNGRLQRDPHTGCYRHSYFRHRLHKRLQQARISSHSVLAILEPDDTTSATIMALVDLLRSRLRDTDEIARFGATRLVVAMDGITEENALSLLARLRAEAAATRQFRFHTGVAARQPGELLTEWLARATAGLAKPAPISAPTPRDAPQSRAERRAQPAS